MGVWGKSLLGMGKKQGKKVRNSMKPQWEGRKWWAPRSEGEVGGCEAGGGLPAEERWELTI